MSDDLYRVLYTDNEGHEQLTGAMPLDAARSRARDLESQGFAVGSVMGDIAAQGYMHARRARTYRGVDIPEDVLRDRTENRKYAAKFNAWRRGVDAELDREKPKSADTNPFAPDLTMSREVADYVLRAVAGLLHEGYWPIAYAEYGPADSDEDDYDGALVLRAADIVSRDKIKDTELQRFIAELNSDAGESS